MPDLLLMVITLERDEEVFYIMDVWIELARIILSFLSIVIIPLAGMIFRRIQQIDRKFNEIIKSVDMLQQRSDAHDQELMLN